MNLQTKNTKKILSFALTMCVLFSIIAVALPSAVAVPGFFAEALTLQPGSTERDINFNWYSDTVSNPVSIVKYAKASAPSEWTIVLGTFGSSSVGKLWHKVGVTGLDYNTEYLYCVSNDGVEFSMIYNFKTVSNGSFQFIAIGDSQLTLDKQDGASEWPVPIVTTADGWANTVNVFTSYFSGASFIMSCGDQVDASGGNEAEYVNFFAPNELRSIPLAPAMGNHDRHNNFDWHYNLPNVTPNGAGATLSGMDVYGNYWYRYNDALFVVLNTSPSPNAATVDAYIAQFDATLKAATEANSDATWLFVQHHKSTAAPASHQSDADIRVWSAPFEALMDTYNVDFVFAGHDHVYSRSWFIQNHAKVTGIDYSVNSVTNPIGTLYFSLNTASGLKYYDIPTSKPNNAPDWVSETSGLSQYDTVFNGKPWYTNVGIQVKVPQFTVVDVTATSVAFRTYRVDTMEIIDEYTVNKVNFVSASADASVNQLKGNTNELAITITELFSDMSANTITKTFTINNNVAATYSVGSYRVYVDTKGNTQIRACYIV